MSAQKPLEKSDSARPIDPNVQQRRASDPHASVWVTASAGSGKTKVLTDRVLRLLLPRADGQAGTLAQRILCLTFTKAAASEMRQRLSRILSTWAVIEEENIGAAKGLRHQLQAVLDRAPTAKEMEAARRLFAEVMEAPGGLQIMTIHAFCQSVLARFPLEAGVPAHFAALEETDADALLIEAYQRVIIQATNAPQSPLAEAVKTVAAMLQDAAFTDMLRAIAKERGQFKTFMQQHFGLEGIRAAVFTALGLDAQQTRAAFLQHLCEAEPPEDIRSACQMLASLKEGADVALSIQRWLDQAAAGRAANFEYYADIFLTKTEPRSPRDKGLPPSAVRKAYPACRAILLEEALRVSGILERLKDWHCADLTAALLLLGAHVLQHYEAIKTAKAALDFDDLILKTLSLLQREHMAGWVQFKLDQGLEHILIDEAQDTNPEQWRIIEALCSPFFDGKGAHDRERTIFTVGDEKQSIYSFQRASPEDFARMQTHFAAQARGAQKPWADNVGLDISFRSAACVLELVDNVFAQQNVQHVTYRRGQAGQVELWPLMRAEKKAEINYWAPPVQVETSTSPKTALAEHIARRLNGMIGQDVLPSRGRTVQAGDILILLRTRGDFVQHLTRALKNYNIPVGGADRMILTQHIAVQDIMALMAFCLCESDDLALAAFLKSPLMGLSEEALFTLAYGRSSSLWQSLLQSDDEGYALLLSYLQQMKEAAQGSSPFEFCMKALYGPCPMDAEGSGMRALTARLGGDVVDPLEEMLRLAMNFEKTNRPTLQHFLHFLESQTKDIKREQEDAAKHVRIMTVHGAKGLQAPIVILPDTTHTTLQPPAQADRRLLWPDKTGFAVPLWAPRKALECAAYVKASAALEARAEEEHQRLLYVALTRAEDRLYIAGIETAKPPRPESWYFKVQQGLKRIDHAAHHEDGRISIETPQTAPPDRAEESYAEYNATIEIPAWLGISVPTQRAPKMLQPSKAAADTLDLHWLSAISPLENDEGLRFKRGNVTHRLLQILPDIQKERWADAAQQFLDRYAGDLSAPIRQDILKETLAVLLHPEFTAVFGPGSLAEVPVTGRTAAGDVVNGQVDRLLVTPDEILIIDYKTNRPPPKQPEDVPEAYRQQLQSYADLITRIYPGRAVRAALLWTDGPFLMPIDIAKII
jgi:ATP-dependent helicase/nuclease subunit A